MKKTLLILLVALSTSFAGVAQKLGHVNILEVMEGMPEYKMAETKLKQFEANLQQELEAMYGEYQEKVVHFQDLQKSGTASQTLLAAKAKEIEDLQLNIQQYQENGQQELVHKQEELVKPIKVKVETTLNTYGKANGYVYIFDSSSGILLYQGGDDLTAKIKAKLGGQ